ncbi:DUF1934 domain-containing protein [Bacillus marinisedimentorum]|uniref:DUF1934 domain-containing protein n=1 Tax=Bacillus marinisedimentorum TaxID=1821260 RepID=UPI0007DF9626|nr:DUF1934 domain-containing protein [Bacillus marinisedimentorum]
MKDASNAVPVTVRLVTEITEQQRKDEKITMESDGYLHEKAGGIYLTYEETMEGTGSVKTIVKMKNEEVTILRSGAVSMRQQFRQGEETAGHYNSPYGPMEMMTKTHHIESNWHEQPAEGKLKLYYQLSMQGERIGIHRLTITFQENKEGSQS